MRILEVTLSSNDIPGSKKFYADLLGLKTQAQSPSSVLISAGQSKLSFNYSPSIKPVYHLAFNVPWDLLDDVFENLQQRLNIIPASDDGGLIAEFGSWNARSFYFNDNNGNILECIARSDQDEQANEWNPRKFIMNISEIGMVVKNVGEAQRLLENVGIPLFLKGPQTEDFSVLGDDNGLIILKDTKHGWMPNNLTPEAFLTRVLISQKEKLFEVTLTKEKLHIMKQGSDISP